MRLPCAWGPGAADSNELGDEKGDLASPGMRLPGAWGSGAADSDELGNEQGDLASAEMRLPGAWGSGTADSDELGNKQGNLASAEMRLHGLAGAACMPAKHRLLEAVRDARSAMQRSHHSTHDGSVCIRVTSSLKDVLQCSLEAGLQHQMPARWGVQRPVRAMLLLPACDASTVKEDVAAHACFKQMACLLLPESELHTSPSHVSRL